MKLSDLNNFVACGQGLIRRKDASPEHPSPVLGAQDVHKIALDELHKYHDVSDLLVSCLAIIEGTDKDPSSIVEVSHAVREFLQSVDED